MMQSMFSSTDKPNILFILADDLGAWALGSAGNQEIITPHLDRLAAEGMRFENFFCASPVCSPARASILTGTIPSRHGVHDWIRSGNIATSRLPAELSNDKAFAAEQDNAYDYLQNLTFPEVLANHGYTCALSGKWHLGDSMTPHKGFKHWFTIAQGGGSYMKPMIIENGKIQRVDAYITDLTTDRAITYMERLAGESAPFYLSVHYTAPHSPWNRSEHPEPYLRLYDDCPFESVPELPDHPDQIASCPRGDGEKRKELLRGYYAAVTAMDAGIGQLMDKLDELGLREDTLVIFMSDNGMNMGHHGIWGKGNGTFPLNMFDTSVKVPAIFSHPGIIPAAAVNDDLASQYDLFPTLLEYAGIPAVAAEGLVGRSFSSLLQGQSEQMQELQQEQIVIYDEYGPVRMIRTRDWKYIHRYPYGPHELYDLRSDPVEQTNRLDDPSCADILSDLRARLSSWFRTYVDPDVDGVYSPVSGFGQLKPLYAGHPEVGSFMPQAKPPQ